MSNRWSFASCLRKMSDQISVSTRILGTILNLLTPEMKFEHSFDSIRLRKHSNVRFVSRSFLAALCSALRAILCARNAMCSWKKPIARNVDVISLELATTCSRRSSRGQSLWRKNCDESWRLTRPRSSCIQPFTFIITAKVSSIFITHPSGERIQSNFQIHSYYPAESYKRVSTDFEQENAA